MCIVAGIGVFLYLVHMDVNYNAEGGYVNEDTAGSYIMRALISLDTAILGTFKDSACARKLIGSIICPAACCLFDSYQLDVFLYRKFEAASSDEIVSLTSMSPTCVSLRTELRFGSMLSGGRHHT